VQTYARTYLVNNSLGTATHTFIEGLVIVRVDLFMFLGSFRAALLTAITFPLSRLFAFICMHFTGIPANRLSLGALDFGIIVDGTLIMVEHIVHALEARRSTDGPESIVNTIRDAALEVERPIFFSLIIIVAAYIPLFTLERVERRLFTPMAYTVCYALLGSMLLALTLIPVLATYLFRNAPAPWENPVLRWLQARYERALRWSVAFPTRVLAAAAVVVALAFVLGTFLGTEFLPQLDEGVVWIRANFPAGISLSKSADLASDIRRLVKQSPEVREVASQTGRNDDGTDPYGPKRNEMS